MNDVSKKRVIHLRLFIIMTCAVVYFCLIYTHYNMPVFHQVIAHKFYVSVETKYSEGERGNFACLAVNCAPSISLFNQNKAICDGGSVVTNYTYTVSGKIYDVVRWSYIRTSVCNPAALTVYYFPLFPSWSVIDNSMPTGSFWANFLKSTQRILVLLLFYLVFSAFLLRGHYSFKNLYSTAQQDKNAYIFIGAVCYPLLVISSFQLLSVFDVFADQARHINREYRDLFKVVEFIVFLSVIYMPSFVLLCSYFKKTGKKKYVFSFIIVCLFYYLHMVLQSQLALFFLYSFKN